VLLKMTDDSQILITVIRLIHIFESIFNWIDWTFEFLKLFHLFLFIFKHSVILQSLQILTSISKLWVLQSLRSWF